MNSYGSSVTRVSAPLWRITMLPRQTSSESVNDFGCGQDEHLPQLLESLPADRPLVAATAEPESPGFFRLPTDHVQQAGVPAHPLGLEVATSLLAPPPVLVVPRERAIAPTPSPERLGRATQTLAGCLTFDHPISPA